MSMIHNIIKYNRIIDIHEKIYTKKEQLTRKTKEEKLLQHGIFN
jgi:hypothetical protein